MVRAQRLLLLAALLPAAAHAQAAPAPASPAALAPLQALDPAATPLPAPAPPADPTAHHHLGFFIRPEGGYAWLVSSTRFQGSTITLDGSGATLALAVGAAVSENLILAATGWHYFVTSPEIKLDGSSLGTASGSTASLVGYGVAVTWYLHPSNFYLTVNPAMTQLVATDGNGGSLTSDVGPGLRAAAGKEWWVSDHWGVGLAASVTLCWNKGPEATAGATWRTSGLNLTLSATWN